MIGSDPLGLRIGEQLERDGLEVTLVAVPGSWLAGADLPDHWTVFRARPDAAGVLARAGLATAEALLAVSDEDELNLGTALQAREARPGLRLVMRQFNVRLGKLLEGYLPEARILSPQAAVARGGPAARPLPPAARGARRGVWHGHHGRAHRRGPAAAGRAVVAIDPGPRAGMAALLRTAGVPLVEGPGSDERTLLYANLPNARALVVATSGDHRNLEIALVARSLVPGLPVVLRLFDPDLCRRAASTFGIEATFSGATLGAGLFTAFADHGTRVASLHFDGRGHALHRLEAAAETSVEELRRRLPSTVVASSEEHGRLRIAPSGGDVLAAGASLFVLVPDGPADPPA